MRNLNVLLFVTFVLWNLSCISQKRTTNVPFEVSNASYFSWAVHEQEKGTTVEVELKNIAPGVEFDSIIFRNVMLPVRLSENKKGKHTLSAILPAGNSRLPVQTRYVARPDQLIFHFEGERRTEPLTQITRKDMIYY